MIDDSSKPRAAEQCTFMYEAGQPPGFECLSGGCYGKTFKDAHSAIIKGNPTLKIFPVWERPEEEVVEIMCAADAKLEQVRYWWEPFLPLGRLIHFMGISGQGKSPVTVDIAARNTRGAPWPDGSANTWGPRSVVMMNMEDEFESVILPRFLLANGDPRKLHFVKGTRVTNDHDGKNYLRNLALDHDIALLISRIRENENDNSHRH